MQISLKASILPIVGLFMVSASINAQNAEELFQKGNSLTWDHRYKEALMYVDSSLRIDSLMWQRYAFRADIKVKLGMIGSAIDDVTKCIERSRLPSSYYNKLHEPSYYYKRAQLNLLNSDCSAAMKDINTSLALYSGDWRTHYFRSELLLKQNHLKESLADLSKAIKLNNSESSIFLARGKLRLTMGDTEGACQDLKKVVAWGFDEYQPLIDKNCK